MVEKNIRIPDLPVVDLPGSDGWRHGYEYGNVLERRFPGQDGGQLALAIEYNSRYDGVGPADQEVTNLVMVQQGEHDGDAWIWRVTFIDGTTWMAKGWCDYTGWDCQSSLVWTRT